MLFFSIIICVNNNNNNNNNNQLYVSAGDHVKFNFPMASSTTILAWSIVDFPAGYNKAGEMQNALDGIRWATDYFLKSYPWNDKLYAQVNYQ